MSPSKSAARKSKSAARKSDQTSRVASVKDEKKKKKRGQGAGGKKAARRLIPVPKPMPRSIKQCVELGLFDDDFADSLLVSSIRTTSIR